MLKKSKKILCLAVVSVVFLLVICIQNMAQVEEHYLGLSTLSLPEGTL